MALRRLRSLRWGALVGVALGALLLLGMAGEPAPGPEAMAGEPGTKTSDSVAGASDPVAEASDPVAEASDPAPVRDARLEALLSGRTELVADTLEGLAETGDAAYAGPLIDLLRASEVGLVQGVDRRDVLAALRAVSGQDFGADWHAWLEWFEGGELRSPAGTLGWKGRLLGRIDPNFARLLAYGSPARIRPDEIVWGGVAFEGIPALDGSPTLSAADASWLGDDEPVFGIEIEGDARAYPLRILDWHEMANDTIGGVPIALAYCTLCGSGIAYEARDADGQPLTFGSSGFLYRSNKLMFDHETQSLWNQFTGRPVVGALAEEGSELELRIRPSVVTTWGDWKARHPGTRVLSLETGFRRPYEPGAAYADYFASDETMFPARARSRALPAKARVFGLELEGAPKAWSIEALADAGVLNDQVGGRPVVLVSPRPVIAVEGKSVRSGATSTYVAGVTVRAFERGGFSFRADADGGLRDEHGDAWTPGEEALVRTRDGKALERLAGVQSYWFAWNGFHPRTALHGAETRSTADAGS